MLKWLPRNRFVRALLLLSAVGSAGWGYYRWTYPYGYNHCCDKALIFALNGYAEDHGGAYPAGEASPEASLSLLYPRYADAHLLRGKTVPLEVAGPILAGGGRLGPDTCGWHYVEGLTLSDDRRLALAWDKAKLGHSGQRNSDGGATVLFVNMGYEYVPGERWAEFLRQQEELLAARKKNRK